MDISFDHILCKRNHTSTKIYDPFRSLIGTQSIDTAHTHTLWVLVEKFTHEQSRRDAPTLSHSMFNFQLETERTNERTENATTNFWHYVALRDCQKTHCC